MLWKRTSNIRRKTYLPETKYEIHVSTWTCNTQVIKKLQPLILQVLQRNGCCDRLKYSITVNQNSYVIAPSNFYHLKQKKRVKKVDKYFKTAHQNFAFHHHFFMQSFKRNHTTFEKKLQHAISCSRFYYLDRRIHRCTISW